MGIPREDALGIGGEAGDQVRIERVPRALPDEAHDTLLAPEQALKRGIAREMDDPHRQRNLLALRAPERPVAVPALEQVGQQALKR